MKQILSVAACLLMAVPLFAQPQGGRPSEEQRKKEFERIQAEKIAFITQELDLTPEEAQVFWPVYNQCWKELLAANKKKMDAFGEFRGDKAEGLSDAELEKKLNAAQLPMVPSFLPLYSDSGPWQASSITLRLCFLAITIISSILQGFP